MVDDEFSVPAPDPNPLDIAELAYEAYFSGDTGKVIGRALDGLGDKFVPGYYVLSRMMAAPIFATATGDAQVWAFAEIGDPLAIGNPVG